MKKSTIMKTGVVVLFATFALASCKKNKCYECHYDKDGGEVELGEYCGDDAENLEANGYNHSDGNTYEAHCGEH